ncbi:hypothetical protein PR048_030603 [Dryococelus australis]|uniref:Uncharacterized protein n=1 Tax=Dryococelus australis TaxID=614101 RepID=A0ABQ9G9F0_9NEOP|nr:hypothetical protein PR048_030603 [Dryococelus australis]
MVERVRRRDEDWSRVIMERLNITVLSVLELASFLHWLLHGCEATPFLTELHVIGAHNCEVFIYKCRFTKGVSHEVRSNDKRIAKIHLNERRDELVVVSRGVWTPEADCNFVEHEQPRALVNYCKVCRCLTETARIGCTRRSPMETVRAGYTNHSQASGKYALQRRRAFCRVSRRKRKLSHVRLQADLRHLLVDRLAALPGIVQVVLQHRVGVLHDGRPQVRGQLQHLVDVAPRHSLYKHTTSSASTRHKITPIQTAPFLGDALEIVTGGVVVRPLASHLGKPSSIPGGVAPMVFAYRNRAGRCHWVGGFSRGSPAYPCLCVPVLLHNHPTSLSSVLKTLSTNIPRTPAAHGKQNGIAVQQLIGTPANRKLSQDTVANKIQGSFPELRAAIGVDVEWRDLGVS